jgi:hypothetical protein
MVGQAVGATGESPKNDRQSRVLRGTVPRKMPIPTKSCSFSRLVLRTSIEASMCPIQEWSRSAATWRRSIVFAKSDGVLPLVTQAKAGDHTLS